MQGSAFLCICGLAVNSQTHLLYAEWANTTTSLVQIYSTANNALVQTLAISPQAFEAYGGISLNQQTDRVYATGAMTTDYVSVIQGGSTSSATSQLTVNSQDTSGAAITGYYVALYGSSGSVAGSGFTPDSFATTVGAAYTLQADGYGSCTFSAWSNGATTNPVPFTATSGALTLTADYDCAGTVGATSTIHVSTVNGADTAITGYYITLWQGGTLVTSCFSACSFTVNDGQTYQVGAASYGPETFSHWQNDGSTGM
jgi:hypothetical protein